MSSERQSTSSELLASTSATTLEQASSSEVGYVKTLDPRIDEVLGGGFATGYISEIAGESSVGKTQLLYGLLLSVQLPPPAGLGKSAIYLAAEDDLNTRRLAQLLKSNPAYAELPEGSKPSMDRILTQPIKSLAAQQHVLEHQLEPTIDANDVGLVVIDSITANFRGESNVNTSSGLVNRAAEINRSGNILRRLATEKKMVIIVANQVSDRFVESLLQPTPGLLQSSSPSTPSTQSTQAAQRLQRTAMMTLDHQQRWISGWGDKPNDQLKDVKTPALGMVWSNVIDARIVCKIADGNEAKRRRIINVVFAPWTEQKVRPVEYTIEAEGLVSMEAAADEGGEHRELLDERLWETAEDEEFP